MRVVFMGTPDFSVPTLKKLIEKVTVVAVFTQPDKPVGRGLKMQPSPVKKIATENNIPVFTPEKVSIEEEVLRLKEMNADFFVIVAYGQILKNSVIEIPRYGCINIHSSLLPRWRGAAPIQHAILSGDSESGISTMKIVAKLDAGDVYLQSKTPITVVETAQTLHDRLALMGAELILPTLEGIKEGTLKSQPQDESKVTYASKLTKEMENLDWQKPAKEVDRMIRALNPWPGTKVSLENGQRIKIKSGSLSTNSFSLETGKLFESRGELFLGCTDGAIKINFLQEEGKSPVKYTDFMNGLKGRALSLPLKLTMNGEKLSEI